MPEGKSINIETGSLFKRAQELRGQGYRLSQIGCTAGEIYEINYSFEKEYEFINLKLRLAPADSEIPSISSIYRCAFLYENEINELFGLKIKGMAVDYKGNFYRILMKAPFKSVKQEGKT